jgi:hypothetical protein
MPQKYRMLAGFCRMGRKLCDEMRLLLPFGVRMIVSQPHGMVLVQLKYQI